MHRRKKKHHTPMTRREVEAIRRKAEAEQERLHPKNGLRKTFVNIGRQINEKRKSLHVKRLLKENVSSGGFIAFKMALVSCLLVCAGVIWAKIIVEEVPELKALVEPKANVSLEARMQAAKVFWSFRRSLRDFSDMSSRLDDEGRRDCMTILSQMNSPDFDRANVSSPKLDPNLFLVTPQIQNGLKVKFLLRKMDKQETPIFEGLCLD